MIVIAYNMARELPRTILSLSTAMQLDISDEDYEIIVIDNGSDAPFDSNLLLSYGNNIQVHSMENATASPVPAVNYGLGLAKGELIGVMIDGARMASPRLLATALEAACLHDCPVIGTFAFHLGPDLQSSSVANGYCQAVEDNLLSSVDWEADGYRLFNMSVFAGSSRGGWFDMPAEANALFMKRRQWQDLGGYDPAFVMPGGGLSNLDVWVRACASPDVKVMLLLGEGTFHQVHGGVATNSSNSKWNVYHEEYIRIRGKAYARPTVNPLRVGHLHPAVLKSVLYSAEYSVRAVMEAEG